MGYTLYSDTDTDNGYRMMTKKNIIGMVLIFHTLVVSISFLMREMTLGLKMVSGRVWPGIRMTPGLAMSTISCTRSSSSMWRPDTSRESPRYCKKQSCL